MIWGMIGIPASLLSLGAAIMYWCDIPHPYKWWDMDDGSDEPK
jgi:hypothetical protein